MNVMTDPIGALSQQIAMLHRRIGALEAKVQGKRAKSCAFPSKETASVIAALIGEAEQRFSVPADLINSHCRFDHVVIARDWVIYEARQRGRSMPQIGKALGNRDHTTIAAALKREAARRAA